MCAPGNREFPIEEIGAEYSGKKRKITMGAVTSLSDLKPGSTGEVVSLQARGLTRRRLMDLGLVPGTRVVALRRSPSGDPTAFFIRGAAIALRREESRQVLVRPV
ncbi:FeoA family protein [Moorella sulfitireducens]|uniref:FeoA family protein n=1 Tax=Neomoorella sulfitireducens TaxID=2972948 RepID=UPI0021AC0A31|nr:FeoA family protein [Moorella sulfitireducens]